MAGSIASLAPDIKCSKIQHIPGEAALGCGTSRMQKNEEGVPRTGKRGILPGYVAATAPKRKKTPCARK
jgi:hypothetical protein